MENSNPVRRDVHTQSTRTRRYQAAHRLRSPRAALTGAVCAALLAVGAAAASGEPAAVETKRAQVQAIEAELQEIDHQVEDAAEAYNGARYTLSLVRTRIAENRTALARTERDLSVAREHLAKRLRVLYATPPPSLVDVLVSSGSVTAAVDQIDMLDRIGRQDADLVGGLRDSKTRLQGLRAELRTDGHAAQRNLAAAAAQRETVEALLMRRQTVLANAKGELARLLEAERQRERRIAAAAAERARARQAAEAAAETRTPRVAAAEHATTTADEEVPAPAPAPQAAPAQPEPSAPASAPAASTANARAAAVAMEQLGVPYVWGGASPSGGFDCSGLASYAYAQVGKSVPHYTVSIWNAFPKIPAGQLAAGDLVFFRNLGHMGIYIGGGQYVNAPQTGDVVKVSSMSARSDYVGAVRP